MYSIVDYTGDGANKIFSVPFPYIAQADVEVYVAGVLQTLTTHYTFTSTAVVTFITAPPAASVVRIKRNTQKTTKLVDFTEGSVLAAGNLDLSSDQMLMVSQEVTDEFNEGFDALTTIVNTHKADVANPHSTTKAQVGLGSCDDTSDATKNSAVVTLTNKTLSSPKINENVVCTSTSTELNKLTGCTSTTAELNKLTGTPAGLTPTELGYVDGVTSPIQTQLNTKAPLASPAFTGNATAPTQAIGDNSTRLATTQFVYNQVAAVTGNSFAATVLANGNMSQALNNILGGSSISFTKTGTGIYNITWVNSCPALATSLFYGAVTACLLSKGFITASLICGYEVNATILINTYNSSGTAADLMFSVLAIATIGAA